MKRYVVALIALCILGLTAACVLVLVGCQSASEVSVAGQDIPQDFVYAGNRYICTGVNVAKQDVDASTPSKVMYIGTSPGILQSGEYDVYLIDGIYESEAIALKIGMGGYYSYYKYEKVYGQEEPADFEYQGRDYVDTGEIVDTERVASATGTPERLSYLSSVVYQGTTYEVYSIEAIDENQAIALRIAKAGKTVGFYYYYFKYESR